MMAAENDDDDPAVTTSLAAATREFLTTDDDKKCIIRVKNIHGEEILFRVKRSTKMERIFEEYAKRKGINNIDSAAMNFRFNDKDIQPDDTAASLGLQEIDIIEFRNNNSTEDNNMIIDEEDEGPIIIRVKNNRGGEETLFKINPSAKMQKVFQAYAQRHGIDAGLADMNFKFHGKDVQPNDTATSLGLQENDIITCLTTQNPYKFKELHLYTNFTHCSYCNLPPPPTDDNNKNQKLLTCSDCISAAYHNITCQRSHWKIHKQVCGQLSQSLLPLKELIRWNKLFKTMKQQQQQQYHHSSGGSSSTKKKKQQQMLVWCWWHPDNENGITNDTLQHTNHVWRGAVEQWNTTEEYLRAMRGMQVALEAYQRVWPYIGKGSGSFDEIWKDDNDGGDGGRTESGGCGGSEQKKKDDDVLDGDNNNDEQEEEGEDFFETSMVLAKRLLFLAYCELDGGQIASARQRLVSQVVKELSYYELIIRSSFIPFFLNLSHARSLYLCDDNRIHHIQHPHHENKRFNAYLSQTQSSAPPPPPLTTPTEQIINLLPNPYSTMPTWNSC
jgi:hypothetical protein